MPIEFNQTSYRILCGISFFLSIPSLIASGYIIYSWYQAKHKKNHQQNDLLNNYVAYMSMADFLLVFMRGTYVSNPAFKWVFMSELSNGLCGFIGAVFNFSAICTSTCNFVIVSFILLPMLCGVPMYKISERNSYILVFSVVICIICIILPFFTGNNSYGFTDNAGPNYGLPKYQCWIVNPSDYLLLYGFVFVYFWWAVLMVCITFCRYRKDKAVQQLISRLFWYSVAFIFVWSGPVIDRTYRAWVGDISTILMSYHWITIHCVGWTNAWVWYSYMKTSTNNQVQYNSMNDADSELTGIIITD